MSKTTEKHYAAFKAEVERCVRLWRIVGWRIETLHEKCEDSRAQFRSSAQNHVADIVLNKEWDDEEPTIANVVKAARHEVVHLLVAELHEIAVLRYVTNDQRIHALESTVRHLEDILP